MNRIDMLNKSGKLKLIFLPLIIIIMQENKIIFK